MTPVDPQARALLERWAATPSVPVERLTATVVRQEDRMVLDLQAAPDRLHAVDDIDVPGPAGAMTARVYRPGPGRLQTLLYLHGGGFVIGPEGYDAPLRQLAVCSGCLIVALRCRLAPEHRFPAAVEDALAGVRWLAGNVSAVGGRDVPIGLAGDSSGGNLAAVVARTLTQEGIPLAFQVLLYPMLDATAGSPSYDEFAARRVGRVADEPVAVDGAKHRLSGSRRPQGHEPPRSSHARSNVEVPGAERSRATDAERGPAACCAGSLTQVVRAASGGRRHSSDCGPRSTSGG